MAVAQYGPRHDVGEDQGYETGEQTEDQKLSGLAPDTLQVHLETGQEHDIVESDASEDLEGDIALQDVQTIFTDDDTRQYHTNDVRNAQFTHDNRRKENNHQHDEENHRGVSYWEICCYKCHFVCKDTNFFVCFQKKSYLCSQIITI